MLKTEIAELMNKDGQMFDIAQKITYNRNLSTEEKEVAQICDAWVKEIASNGTDKYGVDSYFKTDECKEKVKKTNLERFGCEYPSQNEKVNQKRKDTLMSRYGVINPKQYESFKEKSEQTTMIHYGVKNPMQNSHIKNKVIETNIKKYGVSNAMKSIEFQEQAKKTLLDRYGVDNPSRYKEFYQKAQDTLIKNYGVDNPSKSNEIKTKRTQTIIEKYGVDSILKVPEIQCKIKETLFQNGTCRTSSQQKYICDLYQGILNYSFNKYNLDILVDNNIDVEYDGKGHDLGVIIGTISKEEFNQKEIIRNNILKRSGYCIIRLISKTDKLPQDDVLLHILEFSKNYFHTTNHTWIEWHFDENMYYNAENKQGVFYDFGELNYVKQSKDIA